MNDNINIPDSTITTNLTFRQLVLMNMQQLTNFPYIEKDFDALTDYELLCLVVKFLNDVISNQNEQNDSITRMYNSFLALQDYVNNTKDELEDAFNTLNDYVRDYFANLDVQDEINNKLDEMLEDGVLEQIIEQYIQSSALWGFDSVEEMKQATNFTNGSYAKTLGFYSINDGGSAIYKIRDKSESDNIDEMFLISLTDNSLVAELIYDDINIKQLGAKGNNSFDNTSIIQAAFDNGINKKIYIPTGTYLIDNSLTIAGSCHIIGEGENSIIKYNGNNANDWIIKIPFKQAPQFSTIENLKLDGNYIANGIFDGESGTGNPTRTTFNDLNLNACVIGIRLNSMGSNIDNCYIFGEYQASSERICRCTHGIYITSSDNRISNTRIYGFSDYGLFCNGSSNRITNVKTALCGVGAYFSKDSQYASIESQENYFDNIQINGVRSSSFYITSSGAGIIKQETPTIPSTLNEYSLLKITDTKDTVINGTLLAGLVFGTENYSREGYFVNVSNSIGININVSADCYVQTSTGVPQVVKCDSIAGINLIVNGSPYRVLSKHEPTFNQTSNTTKKFQNNNEITFNISSSASSASVALLSFPIENNITNLAVATSIEENITINRLTYQYHADGTDHNIFLPITNRLNVKNPFAYLFRIYENIADILASDTTYQNYVTQGIEITGRKILINADLSNYSGNRTNVKAIIDVYYD